MQVVGVLQLEKLYFTEYSEIVPCNNEIFKGSICTGPQLHVSLKILNNI